MLTIPFLQLETHLQRADLQCYLICGDDPFLKNELVHQLRQHAEARGYHERHHFDLQNKEAWESCFNAINNMDLFQQLQLIEIHLPDGALTKSIQQQLHAIIMAQQTTQFFILVATKLDEKALKSTWITDGAYQKGIIRIPFFNLQTGLQWIEKKAAQFNLKLNKEIIQWIHHQCNNQWLYVQQLFEKLSLLDLKTPITLTIINELLSDESHFSIFELLDPLLNGNVSQSLYVLDNLKNNTVDAILVLWAITKELRVLIEAKDAQTQAAFNWPSFYEKHRIFSHRQPTIKRAVQRYSRTHLETQLIHTLEIELAIKGILSEEPWNKLTTWCQNWCTSSSF